MPLRTIRTIPEFNHAVTEGTEAYYKSRGLTGQDMFQRQCKLGLACSRRRTIEDMPINEIKRQLQLDQAPLLDYPDTFNMAPIDNPSFLNAYHGGIPVNSSLSPQDIMNESDQLRNSGMTLVLAGECVNECHFAGTGTRLELSGEAKFSIKAGSLVQALENFAGRINKPEYGGDPLYIALAAQIREFLGVNPGQESPDDINRGMSAIKARFAHMSDLTIGDRRLIEKMYEAAKCAEAYGWDVRSVWNGLKFDIIINEETGEKILSNFIDRDFYQLNPENVMFMNQAKLPTRYYSPEGELIEDHSRFRLSLGNHGLIPLQSYLEGQKFRFRRNEVGGGFTPEQISPSDYSGWINNCVVRLVENIDDTTQFDRAFDWTYIGLIKKYGETLGFQMFMKLVLQKIKNPQKGGFLAALTNGGRNAVLETDVASAVSPNRIQLLNANMNGFFLPGQADNAILGSEMINNTHPTFTLAGWENSDTSAVLRLDPKVPQGDRNLYLPTMYVSYIPPSPIEDLKDPVDILPALMKMAQFENSVEKMRFARQRLGIQFKCYIP